MPSRALYGVALGLCAFALGGCIPQSASLVDTPLQPGAGEPVAYLVGSIGSDNNRLSGGSTQQLLIRKRGSQDQAAARWRKQGFYYTPADVTDAQGDLASVFVLPLKPGDYELYDYRLQSFVGPASRVMLSIRHAREQFTLPLHLEAGKAYYLGEFRGVCASETRCGFVWRNPLARDEAIARRKTPQLPTLIPTALPMDDAKGVFFPEPAHPVTP
ncbi:hypothetical protein [Pseudomonas putida]